MKWKPLAALRPINARWSIAFRRPQRGGRASIHANYDNTSLSDYPSFAYELIKPPTMTTAGAKRAAPDMPPASAKMAWIATSNKTQ